MRRRLLLLALLPFLAACDSADGGSADSDSGLDGLYVAELTFPDGTLFEGVTYTFGLDLSTGGGTFSLGPESREALLSVFVPSGDVDDLDAWVRGVAETMGETSPLDTGLPWVETGYSIGGIDIMGSILAGRRDGRAFYVLETMPLDMGDGFGPRSGAVLGEWRWDDGSGLVP